MCENKIKMSFISLPTGKPYEKSEKINLKIFRTE